MNSNCFLIYSASLISFDVLNEEIKWIKSIFTIWRKGTVSQPSTYIDVTYTACLTYRPSHAVWQQVAFNPPNYSSNCYRSPTADFMLSFYQFITTVIFICGPSKLYTSKCVFVSEQERLKRRMRVLAMAYKSCEKLINCQSIRERIITNTDNMKYCKSNISNVYEWIIKLSGHGH